MKNNDLNGIVFIFGVASLAYAAYASYKLNKVLQVIDEKVEDISENVEVDISKSMVDCAVEKAVAREVDKAVQRATKEAISDVRRYISMEAKTAVHSTYSDLKPEVAKEIKRQIDDIDISGVKEEIISEAKDQIAEKFDDKLDDLLDDFNSNLENVSKIYNSIAETIIKKDNKETVFRLL